MTKITSISFREDPNTVQTALVQPEKLSQHKIYQFGANVLHNGTRGSHLPLIDGRSWQPIIASLPYIYTKVLIYKYRLGLNKNLKHVQKSNDENMSSISSRPLEADTLDVLPVEVLLPCFCDRLPGLSNGLTCCFSLRATTLTRAPVVRTRDRSGWKRVLG